MKLAVTPVGSLLEVCPTLPAKVQSAIDEVTGLALGLFGGGIVLAVVVAALMILIGRAVHHQMLAKVGVVSLMVVAAIAAVLSTVAGIVLGLWGTGCIG